MAYGLPSQYGVQGAYQGQYGSPNEINSDYAAQSANIRSDLNSTLRSMRDSLSTSLQTLNLTMAGIHNQLRNMSSALSPTSRQVSQFGQVMGLGNTYIPSPHMSSNLGAMSTPMASYLASASFPQLAMGTKPYTVGGYEWALERQRELNARVTQFGANAGLNVLSSGVSMYGASRILNAIPALKGAPAFIRGAAGLGLQFGLASAIVEPVVGVMHDASRDYTRGASMIQRLSPQLGGEMFTRQQAYQAYRGVTNYAGNEIGNRTFYSTNLGTEGASAIISQGLQNNLFQGSSPGELVKQMEKAASTVKFLTGILGSKDINETMASIGMLKSMGVNALQNTGYTSSLGINAFKYGQTMGIPGSQVLQQAMQIGGSAYMSQGLPGFVGIQPAMQTMALANEMEKRRYVSAAQIAAAGGNEGITSQLSNFNAGLTRNPAVGKLMFAAGMVGGKYSKSKMEKALSGGYMNLMQTGLGNLAGDVGTYADFMMNQEDFAAQAALQGGGGYEDQMLDVLFAGLGMQPGMEHDNTAAYYLMQMASQNGTPISAAAAKEYVMKKRRPNIRKALEMRANRNRDKGFYAQNALESGAFRPISRIGERVVNTYDSAVNYIGNIGRDITDKVVGLGSLFGSPEGGGYTSQVDGLINDSDFANAKLYSNQIGGLDRDIDQRAFKTAYGNMQYDDDMYKMLRRGVDNAGDLSTVLGSTSASRSMEPILLGSQARNLKEYYKAASGQDTMFTGRAEQILKASGMDPNIVYQNFGSDFTKPDEVFKRLANGMSKDSLNFYANNATSSEWYNGVNASAMTASLGIKGAGSLTKDELLAELLARGGENDALSKYAASNNISRRQVAFATANKLGSGTMSNFGVLQGADDQSFMNLSKAAGTIAFQTGNNPMADILSQQSNNDLNLSTNVISEAYKALGLSQEIVDRISKEPGGMAQLENFAFILSETADGHTIPDHVKVTDPALAGILNNFTGERNKGKIMDAIKGSSLLSPTGSYGDISLRDRFVKGYSADIGGRATNNILKGLTEIGGFSIDKETMSNKIQDNSLGDYLMTLDPSTQEGKSVKAELQRVKNLTASERRDYAKSQGLSKQTLALNDDDLEKSIFNSLISSKLGAPAEKSSEESKDPLDKYAAPDAPGGAAIRVITTTASIDIAKDKALKETLNKQTEDTKNTVSKYWHSIFG